MNSLRCCSLLAVTVVLGACSLLDLGGLELARCNTDADCAVFGDPSGLGCEVYVCAIDTGQCLPQARDDDGDGDPSTMCGGGDCDDTDPTISSFGTEVCDGFDNDCNGLLDGPDEDDDGDGNPDLCAGPGVASDCDDSDPFTYVGAPELCDGIDNDCFLDALPRLSGGRLPQPGEDADGDGFAAIDDTCLEMPGDPRFLTKMDCDDADPTVHAMAIEVCDGLDNDCDGIPDNLFGNPTPGEACLPVDVEAGDRHTCVLRRDGRVTCWGNNGSGQLGDSRKPADTALLVGVSDVQQIAAGGQNTCALTGNGDVICWGSSQLLEAALSFNFAPSFGQVRDVAEATQISVGGGHACAIVGAGEVRCWGFPCPGEALDGSLRSCDESYLAVPVPGVTDAVHVVARGSDTCVTHATGEVTCMGFNIFDRLGIGGGTIGKVSGVSDAVEVVISPDPCARLSDGTVTCWGVDATSAPYPPTPVAGLSRPVVQLAGAGSHVCARLDDDSLQCWGRNGSGQLATADTTDRTEPTAVAGLGSVRDVTAGGSHTCALLDDGVWCWGLGTDRQLGTGRTDHPTTPGPLSSVIPQRAGVIAFAMQITGGFDSTCFRMPNLEVRCAGQDAFGELGGAGGWDELPTRRFGFEDVVDVAIGYDHTCLVRTGGTVHCFGRGRRGETGHDGPDGVEGISGAVRVVGGQGHTCALLGDGTVTCWGATDRGQAGLGSSTDCGVTQPACRRTVLPVELPAPVIDLSAGLQHTCAVTDDDRVFCWGDNAYGQLGRGTPQASGAPLELFGLPADDRPVKIAAGGESTCVLLSGGSVWCWGRELASGASRGSSPAPTAVSGISGVVQIAMTDASACARVASGTVRCWGANGSGRLGNGTSADSPFPVDALSLDDARDLGCGEAHCCATRTSGQSVCWGAGSQGQLANDTTTSSPSPVSVASMLSI